MKNIRNVPYYIFGKGSISELNRILSPKRNGGYVVFFIDSFFKEKMNLLGDIELKDRDILYFTKSKEPSTSDIDFYSKDILDSRGEAPQAIVAIGGGSTMDTGKAVSNLIPNGGKAEDYQGWDLLKKPGIYKIGVPTISGTGAEATRTCVLMNTKKNMKLGMNSDWSIFDQIILDPNLTKTVPREQYFYTGMDTYIHCIESLNGSHRHPIGDSYSREALRLVKEVFYSDDMMSDENREKLMVASYLGGCAIATSYVGVIHPFSAGLSVVFEMPHCVGNCITMHGMKEFYPKEYDEFFEMAERQNINVPKLKVELSDETFDRLFESTVIHEKPLKNALGDEFRSILNRNKVKAIFEKMIEKED